MSEKYGISVTKFNPETGEHETLLDEDFEGFMLCGQYGEGRNTEIVGNVNLFDIASMLAQGKHSKPAVTLAQALMTIQKDRFTNVTFEDSLLKSILRGIDDE